MSNSTDDLRERNREAVRRYRARNPEKIREYRRRYKLANPDWGRRTQLATREKVFDHYGRACACCGTADRLTIDHMDGDGRQHRAETGCGSGTAMYLWLIRNGFPDGFQTLCHRCNNSKKNGPACRLDHGA